MAEFIFTSSLLFVFSAKTDQSAPSPHAQMCGVTFHLAFEFYFFKWKKMIAFFNENLFFFSSQQCKDKPERVTPFMTSPLPKLCNIIIHVSPFVTSALSIYFYYVSLIPMYFYVASGFRGLISFYIAHLQIIIFGFMRIV